MCRNFTLRSILETPLARRAKKDQLQTSHIARNLERRASLLLYYYFEVIVTLMISLEIILS